MLKKYKQEYWCGKTNSEATKRTPNLQYEFVYIKHTVANVFCWYICKNMTQHSIQHVSIHFFKS